MISKQNLLSSLASSIVRYAHASNLAQLPNAIDIIIAQHESWMKSAVRGGVRMALALMQMHYTTAESWRLATGIPT